MRILISPLGTGRYEVDKNGKKQLGYTPSIYQFPDKSESAPTKLTAKAISEKYDIDRVYIVGTMKSIWDEIYSEYAGQAYDEEVHLALIDGREQASASTPLDVREFDFLTGHPRISAVPVRYGINREELEENRAILLAMFNEIAKIADKEPVELHIDITHSFRSLSFFIFNLLVYLKELKGDAVSITNVHYGMLELGFELEKRRQGDGAFTLVPVIDLSEVYNITQMTQAAGEFKKYGYGYTLAGLTDDGQLAREISSFSDLVNMQYIPQIRGALPNLVGLMKKSAGDGTIEGEIAQKVLGEFTRQFPGNVLANPALTLIELAEWYCKGKRYGQAYSTLYEGLYVHVCTQNGLDPNDRNTKGTLTSAMTRQVMGDFNEEYHTIRIIRNALSHLSEDNSRLEDYKVSIKKLPERIRRVRSIICGT